MRIQLLSDLHFEFHADKGRSFVDSLDNYEVDVLVVAGDLVPHDRLIQSLSWLRKRYAHVVFVAGNHEYYGSSPEELYEIRQRAAEELKNVHWLERSSVEIDGVRFVGATLWFDDLGGRKNYISDFRMIKNFEPWVYEEFRVSRDFLKSEVRAEDVVVTHYLPSYKSVAPQFKGSSLNCFFVSNVEDIISAQQPRLWLHGHTHASCDYKIDETRVVCNPFGYVGQETNQEFDERKILEVYV